MPLPPRTILCLLAGGRSSRFGSSKLAIHIDDEPALAWQARRLRPALPKPATRHALWLSLAPGQALPPGAALYDRHIPDAIAHLGPLAAIAAVLRAARPRDRILFVPADMLLLTPRHLTRLLAAARRHRSCAVMMSRWADGPRRAGIEPLPSLWRVGPGRRLLKRALAAGVRGPSRLAEWAGAPDVALIDLKAARDASAWRSINRRADLRAVARLLPNHHLIIALG